MMLNKVFCTLFLVPLLLVGCGEEKKENAGSKPKLSMVTSADYPPFEFFINQGSGAKIAGLDMDIAHRVAEYLGYEIETKDVDFSAVIPLVQSGQADFAIAGITPTQDREKDVSFSQPYYFMNNVMIHRIDNDFIRRGDYKGVRIIVQLGSLHEQYAKIWQQQNPGSTVLTLNKLGDAVQELLAGRADGIICDETPSKAYISKYSQELTMQNLEGESFGLAIAFKKDSPLVIDFNRALDHLNEIGALDEIINKWLAQ